MAEQGQTRVLLVDDEADLRWLLAGVLSEAGYAVREAGTADEARELFDEERAEVVVSDVRMPGKTGVDLMEGLHALDARLPVVLISALEDVATAVEAMKLGAYDYLTKPFDNDRLLRVVARASETRELEQEVHRLRRKLAAKEVDFGVSEAGRAVADEIERVARVAELSVLIEGESGTGKEVAARCIHEGSALAGGPFVPVDCGALPEQLMESLLFGHKKGAFTGADRDQRGLFLEAQGGTLFLDELSNLPLGLQAKLLRAIQEREVRPLGSERAQGFDCRILAASNVGLSERVEEGSFRLDLYHRLAEYVLVLPPLRERPADVRHFALRFLQEAAEERGSGRLRLSPDAQALLERQDWPGNLRELRNRVRRAALLAEDEAIGPSDFSLAAERPTVGPRFVEGEPLTTQVRVAADAVERAWIREALDAEGGNKAAAARRLGVDYTTLHRKLKRHGLDS